jgi:tetratricopeptide (TPR) repeat protein
MKFFYLLLFFSSISRLFSQETLIASSDHQTLTALFDKKYKENALVLEKEDLPYQLLWSFNFGKAYLLRYVTLYFTQSVESEFYIEVSTSERLSDFQRLLHPQGKFSFKETFQISFSSPVRFVRLTFFKPLALSEIECSGTLLEDAASVRVPPPDLRKRLYEYTLEGQSWSREEQELFHDLTDNNQLNSMEWADALLIASGIFSVKERSYYKAFIREKWLLHFLNQPSLKNLSDLELAKRLLKQLHGSQSLLQRYDAVASDLRLLFEQGLFNCVSSVLLFQWLGRELDLQISIVEGKDHTFGYLYTATQKYPVETTSAQGFDLYSDSSEAFEKSRGFSPYPPHTLREVSALEGIAMIPYNEGVKAFKAQNYPQAIAFYERSLFFDPVFPPAYENLFSSYTYLIAQGAKEQRFLEILERFPTLYQLFPAQVDLLQNYHIYVLNNSALEQLRQKDYVQALETFQNGLKLFPSNLYLNANLDLAYGYLATTLPRKSAQELLKKAPQTLWLRKKEEELLYLWALSAQSAQAFSEAEGYYKRLKENPKHQAKAQALLTALYDLWAKTIWDQGEYSQAMDLYQRFYLETQEDHFRQNRNVSILQWAKQLQEQKEWEKAIHLYTKSLSLYQFKEEIVYKALFHSLLEQQKEWLSQEDETAQEAIEKQLQALLLLPLPPEKYQALQESLRKAYIEALLKKQEYDKALLVLQPLLPQHTALLRQIYYQWAEFHGSQKNFKAASTIYRKALLLFPQDPLFLNNLQYYETKQ